MQISVISGKHCTTATNLRYNLAICASGWCWDAEVNPKARMSLIDRFLVLHEAFRRIINQILYLKRKKYRSFDKAKGLALPNGFRFNHVMRPLFETSSAQSAQRRVNLGRLWHVDTSRKKSTNHQSNEEDASFRAQETLQIQSTLRRMQFRGLIRGTSLLQEVRVGLDLGARLKPCIQNLAL